MNAVLAACGDGLILYVICSSWNWRRGVAYAFCSAAAILYCSSIIFIGLSVHSLLGGEHLTFQDFGVTKVCFIANTPPFHIRIFVSYSLQAGIDLLSLTAFVINAWSRPRKATQRLSDILFHDGITFLIVTFSLKIAIIIVVGKLPQAPFAISFPACSLFLISSATCRLYLKFCSASTELRRQEYMLRDI
ncbi:hypothetical protein SCHPADRAFT_439860 [Schizopora paradoxa]|uniref:Uncharacterized protein n=1 Tax=Schizopora paradoxa TaxID=27342 RepID=A0A0H2RKA7_9AGAM|nr:hypothetical protein SCHPADRAFT_439860 [Schizopora paradoxa]